LAGPSGSLPPGPTGAPIFFDLQLDTRVFLFTTVVTMLTTLGFGLVPALQATRVDLVSSLKGSRSLSGMPRTRFRGALMVVQVALSSILLIAAVLLFRSLRNIGTLDAGFEPDGVVVSSFDLRTLGYERPRVDAFYTELLRRARTLPGVERAALADFVPMGDPGGTMTVPGMTPPAGQERFVLPYGLVSDAYFATVRQPLIRGRDFTADDRVGAPMVAIVNEALARRFWPGEDPLGKRMRLAREDELEIEIVGVAKNARYASFGGDIGPLVLLPTLQHPGPPLILHIRTSAHVRTGARTSDARADIQRLVREIDPSVPFNGQTMREGMATSLVPARIAQLVFGVSGAVALLLAAGGLYGLVCYTVAQRAREIGIRIALGASRRNVFRVIVGRAATLTAIGVAIGTVIAAALMRFMSALLYGLSPTDPLTFSGIAMLLVSVALLAGYAAARKGLAVDPMVVLRNE
jgi:putative ABC transport system permease protein